MAKWGYRGHFVDSTELPPAAANAGNMATTGTSGVDLRFYFSNGLGWDIVSGSNLEINLHSWLTEEQIADSQTGVAPTLNLTTAINTAVDNLWNLIKVGDSNGRHGVKIICPAGSYLVDYLNLYPGMTWEGANMHETRFVQSSTSTATRFGNILARSGYTSKNRVPNVALRHLTLQGYNALAVSCDGLATENPGNDPDYSAAKTYNSATTEYVSILDFTGDGIKVAFRGRGWFSHTRTQGCTGHGYNIQGPDCFLLHPASGSNGKHSIYCSGASTPRIIDGELWASINDSSGYYAIYIDRCREASIIGGDINAPIFIFGAQGDVNDDQYGYWNKIIIDGCDLKFRDSTFTDNDDGTPFIVNGYIMVQACRSVHITNCTFTPAYTRATNVATYRPVHIVDTTGDCSVHFDCALPPLLAADGVTNYGLFPCGDSPATTNSIDAVFSHKGKVSYRISCPDQEDTQPKFYQSQTRLLGEENGTAPTTGEFGESIEGNVNVGSAVSLTTATVANITSVVLTPGRWEIRATCHLGGSGATGTVVGAGVSTANNTFPGTPKLFNRCSIPFTTITNDEIYTAVIPPYTVNVTANTTYYLNARATFSAGTMAAYGHMEAIRIS